MMALIISLLTGNMLSETGTSLFCSATFKHTLENIAAATLLWQRCCLMLHQLVLLATMLSSVCGLSDQLAEFKNAIPNRQ